MFDEIFRREKVEMIPFSWRNISLQSQNISMYACSTELFTANSYHFDHFA